MTMQLENMVVTGSRDNDNALLLVLFSNSRTWMYHTGLLLVVLTMADSIILMLRLLPLACSDTGRGHLTHIGFQLLYTLLQCPWSVVRFQHFVENHMAG